MSTSQSPLFDTPPEPPLTTDLLDDSATLRHDMTCILLECHRDRNLHSPFRQEVDHTALTQFAALMARRLGPLIGGRYVPKVDERAARDVAVWAAFSGRNHLAVMHEFKISRRLLYSILARKRRALA